MNFFLLLFLTLLPFPLHASILNSGSEEVNLPCEKYPSSFSLEYKAGSVRDIASISSFLSIACNDNSLIFGDIRGRGDENQSREGNAGIGFRAITSWEGIWGIYSFYDWQRSGELKQWHNQATLGTEWLAENWEIRSNGYIPLSEEKTGPTGLPPGIALTNPYMSGTGIYVVESGPQTLHEKPSHGVDAEIGIKIPFIDNLWVHGGGFHFSSGENASLTGGRGRITYDFNKYLSAFAEGQWDDIRGKQGWLGLRVKAEFGGSDNPSSGLKRRMTTPPVRDVDIVLSSTVTGIKSVEKPVTNSETGEQQRIIHVDNTASDGGDGSLEKPFNNLLAAQSAMKDYDIVYIHSGDGTSSGQNSGFIINKTGVQIAGAGSPFVYDGSRFRVTSSGIGSGTVIAPAGISPVITNPAGSGVTVTANGAILSGFTVSQASQDGIKILNASATVDNVFLTANGRYGLYIESSTGSLGNSVSLNRVTSRNNASYGIYALATGSSGYLSQLKLNNITSVKNTGEGIRIETTNGGRISSSSLQTITASGNLNYGTYIASTGTGSKIDEVNISGSSFNSNLNYGLYVQTATKGQIGNLTIESSTFDFNSNIGAYIHAVAGGQFGPLDLRDSVFSNNASYGSYILATGSGSKAGNISFNNLKSQSNSNTGIRVEVTSAGKVGDIDSQNSVLSSNAYFGMHIYVTGTGSSVEKANLKNMTATGNASNGIRFEATTLGQIASVNLEKTYAENNASTGIVVYATSTGYIGTTNITNLISKNNSSCGVQIQAGGYGRIESANLQNITTSDNAWYGTYIYSTGTGAYIGDTIIRDIVSNGNSSTSIRFEAVTMGQIASIDMENAVSQHNAGNGATVYAGTGYIGSARIKNLDARDDYYGFNFQASAGGIIGSGYVEDAIVSNNPSHGVYLYSTGSGSRIGNLTIKNVKSESNSGSGFRVEISSAGYIESTNFQNITSANNASYGAYFSSTGTGFLGDVILNGFTSQSNANTGARFETGSGGIISSINAQNAEIRSSGGYGVYLYSTGTGSYIGNSSLKNVKIEQNPLAGIRTESAAAGQIASLDFQNVEVSGNASYGIHVYSTGTSSSTGTVNFKEILVQRNSNQGIRFEVTSAGQISSVTMDDVTSSNNAGYGLYLYSTGANSTIGSTSINNLNASNNSNAGLLIYALSSGIISGVKIERSSFTENLVQGVWIDDDTNGAFLVDMGGGTLGSVGQNRIFGNAGTDIRLDLDNLQLKARYNWWGNANGLQTNRMTLEGSSTIDTTGYLTEDPLN